MSETFQNLIPFLLTFWKCILFANIDATHFAIDLFLIFYQIQIIVFDQFKVYFQLQVLLVGMHQYHEWLFQKWFPQLLVFSMSWYLAMFTIWKQQIDGMRRYFMINEKMRKSILNCFWPDYPLHPSWPQTQFDHITKLKSIFPLNCLKAIVNNL